MSKTLEELGYEKEDRLNIKKEKIGIRFSNIRTWEVIDIDDKKRTFAKPFAEVTTEELKAIYKYYEDNKWI